MEGKELAEYERDMQESNRRFDQAFRQVLSHTSELELREFGKLFSMDGKKTHDAWDELLHMHATDSTPKPLPDESGTDFGAHQTSTNPMFAKRQTSSASRQGVNAEFGLDDNAASGNEFSGSNPMRAGAGAGAVVEGYKAQGEGASRVL